MDVDQHLSVFRPYARDPGHEDQLTRAALIVMKLVPLAQESFLGMIGCERLSGLPVPRFDLQTENLVLPEAELDGQEVAEFVSVLLSPHEQLKGINKVEASKRRARYDGLIQYGPRLLVVIESKLFATAKPDQAINVNPKGLKWNDSRLKQVKWHELLDRWWNLTELDVLGPTETQILTDFFDFADQNFGKLLPFNHLERCGENEYRRLRRLRTVLEEATGLPTEIHKGGVTAKFPSDRVVTVQQATLLLDGENIRLGMWPAELASQYQELYADLKNVQALIGLADDPEWKVKPNFHIAYRFARGPQRWYPVPHLSGREYLTRWIEDVHDHRAGGRTRAQIEDPAFRQWLVEREYAEKNDLANLDEWLEKQPPGIKFHIRPSIEVTRSWPFADAIVMDRTDKFKDEVHGAIDGVLAALHEPKLKPLRPKLTKS